MNREEAIYFANCLKNNYTVDLNDMEAFCGMAIKALEQEPTTKNNLGVDCISRADAIKAMQNKAKKLKNEDTINGLCGAVAILYELPSITPQLSIPEVTALAEWTEKLTKASEDAYNKGYADGMKELGPITTKDKFKYGLMACGCLFKDGKTWYEHNELIQCFEDLGLFEQEPRKGHWIDDKCTNCGYEVQPWNNTNYCPNCGAKMVEP